MDVTQVTSPNADFFSENQSQEPNKVSRLA
jgi:hypothetical protein